MKSKDLNKNCSVEELKDFFEGEGFNVYLFEQDNKLCAEIEVWTDNFIHISLLISPFTIESFMDVVENYDIDVEIDAYREAQGYRDAFTISQSLEDFTHFHDLLKELALELNNQYKE
ncbi:MAG: hypothetical protein U9Q38_04315 [Thermodesulfobacteriota bacterium]|nr:hypothetical protein [Thermodesulfobacteriota bacterium]